MKKYFWALVVLTLALVSSTTVAFASTISGAANLHQIDQSGIQAKITFTDTGTTLTVDGTATGLVPGQAYFSLLYDVGSKPSGPHACEPSAKDNLTFAQMVVGFWTNNGNGTGTLHAVKSGADYVALTDVHTMSVRHVVGPDFILQACGEVHHSA